MGDLNLKETIIGMSQSGMSDIENRLKTYLIGDTANLLTSNISQVISNVDNYWKGASADQFKEKMKKESDAITGALDELKESLSARFAEMSANFTNSDATIAAAILSGSGLSAGGTSGSPVAAAAAGAAVAGTTGVTTDVDGNTGLTESQGGTGNANDGDILEANRDAQVEVDPEPEPVNTPDASNNQATSTQETTTEESNQVDDVEQQREEQRALREEQEQNNANGETTQEDVPKDENPTEILDELPTNNAPIQETTTPAEEAVEMPAENITETPVESTNMPEQTGTIEEGTGQMIENSNSNPNLNISYDGNIGELQTDFGQSIVDAINSGSTYHENDRCQGWVQQVYNQSGNSGGGGIGAYQAWQQYGVGTDRDWHNIPIGATVYGTGWAGGWGSINGAETTNGNPYGHVGIHIGNGIIVDSRGGQMHKQTLDEWISMQEGQNTINGQTGYVGWGFNSEEAKTAWENEVNSNSGK